MGGRCTFEKGHLVVGRALHGADEPEDRAKKQELVDLQKKREMIIDNEISM